MSDEGATTMDEPRAKPGPGKGRSHGVILVLATVVVIGLLCLIAKARPRPAWGPETLPATRQLGDLSVTLDMVSPAEETAPGSGKYKLMQVTGGYSSWSRGQAPPSALRPARVAWFTVRQGGQPTAQWQIRDMNICDVAGHVTRNVAVQGQSTDQGQYFLWFLAPTPYGRACKLQAVLFRTDSASFTPDETWTVRNVPVPQAGAGKALSGTTTRQGVTLALMAVAPAGRITYSKGALLKAEPTKVPKGSTSTEGSLDQLLTVETDTPHVAVRVSGWTADHNLTLRATDDRGRKAEATGSQSSVDDRGRGYWLLGFRPPSGARTLDLTVIVQKARIAEFRY
jgi:hypothetical protein